jgi:FkbH-like protein
MLACQTDSRSLLKRVTDLERQGLADEALRSLANALRRGELDAEDSARAGKLIGKLRAKLAQPGKPVRAFLLGQCTTTWVANMLTAEAWGRGCALEVSEGEYDNVIQELLTSGEHAYDAVVLLPWARRLLQGGRDRSPAERITEEVAHWTQAWDLIAQNFGARILQIGYDWMSPGVLGHHLGSSRGDIDLVRRVNEGLRNRLPRGAFFLDLNQVSGIMGRHRFYDARRYYWTKQPFSEEGAREISRHIWAGIRALMTGPKKVLVVDLDNTLWGGVVGETGPLGISLGETPDGEAFRSFQTHLKGLSQRGIVLAACSKNNPEDALGPFHQNPQMVLTLSDFARIEASWEPKSIGLRRIAEELSLGLDSFVFVDDNPAEREQIRQALPEVEVVDVGDDPSTYIGALQAGLWFEAVELSEEDTQRTALYQRENERRELQKSFTSMSEYLTSLEMCGSARPIDETTIQRATQLIAKTNQFNVTTRRHSIDDVRQLLSSPDSIGLTLTLGDKFGDHGLIAVLLAVPSPAEQEKTLRIDTWLMSCRVIGRTAEQFFFNQLVERARDLHYQSLLGEFIPTKKNGLVADLFERLGFVRSNESAQGAVTYRFSLENGTPAETFVHAVRPAYA